MLVQEGYNSAYPITEVADNGGSLAEIIVHYAEHVTAAESKFSNIESRLSQLEMREPPMLAQQNQQMAYYIPELQ